MRTGSVFVNNRIHVERVAKKDRVLSQVENTWDSFFMSDEKVTDDFMAERASQEQQRREAF
ncbi:AbrB/MazE/SpoVT family DNA-binding domain-containing protein [Desulfobulbus sp. US2]|nr:AbrB/MazE/SpoVT family DNA-binding domain-containing protein [Desulfobulbus sp. US4]MCW5207890.1 AbrB/MazE/SpoVT family DNA-binding domain-containing protein [Desulfobulbus sp. US2]WLE98701.1 MAG: hypothetical protein QTN59_07630 [Candidatus Electrothrix communis]